MNRLRSKSEEKYFDRLSKNVLKRESKYFRRNVHVNHIDTDLQILKIKNDKQFDIEISGFTSLPSDVCFLFHHIDPFVLPHKIFEIADSDIIITNCKTNKIIAFNEEIKNYPEFINIWVVKKNTIDYMDLDIGDIFFTR